MTIRELYNETLDAYNENKISLETIEKIALTEIVPKKLIDLVVDELENNVYGPTNDFSKDYLCACSDILDLIVRLLNQLEEMEEV